MPRLPKGAGATRDQLFQVAKTLGYNKKKFSEATGLSYWKSRQLVDQLRERKPAKEILGKRNPEAKLAELQTAVDTTGFEFRKPRGKEYAAAIPPAPTKGKTFAKKTASKKFANATRTSYEFEPGKRIQLRPGDGIQIKAIGKGRSQGQDIKQLFSNVGDWEMAWSSLTEEMRRTNFTARKFQVIVIRSGEKGVRG